ncbi:hypothetical protein D3C77_781400 [compost metagenome]
MAAPSGSSLSQSGMPFLPVTTLMDAQSNNSAAATLSPIMGGIALAASTMLKNTAKAEALNLASSTVW